MVFFDLKVKFLTGFDLPKMSRRASKCWLMGIWMSILVALIELYKASTKQSKLLLSKANAQSSDNKDANGEFEAAMKAVKAAKQTQVFNIIKALGDGVTASQSLKYPERFFGFNFSDGMVGASGFTSAALTCYQTYK